MEKQDVLAEIKRVADEMGRPPGWEALQSRSALRKSDWYPHMWLRWGDALAEAGFAPNQFRGKTSDDVLIQNIVTETERAVGHRRDVKGAVSLQGWNHVRRYVGGAVWRIDADNPWRERQWT